MLKNNYIRKEEYNRLAQNLEKRRTPLIFGSPKIHQIIDSFPKLRPIVSGFNSCTCNLSKYVDSFLNSKLKTRNLILRILKDFIIKFSSLKNIPENSFIVTADVLSLYTNIDHKEGAETCFKNL